jgi:integrase
VDETYEIFMPREKNNQRGIRPSAARRIVIPKTEQYIIRAINKYIQYRPINSSEFFFLGIQTKKNIENGLWYRQERIGKKKIESILKMTGRQCGLPELTAHRIRAMTVKSLQREGFSYKQIQSVTGHRSVSGLLAYEVVDEEAKENMIKNLSIF